MNAPAVGTGEQGLEFFAFDVSYVEKLRAGDAHIEGHFVNYFSELIRLKLRSRLKFMIRRDWFFSKVGSSKFQSQRVPIFDDDLVTQGTVVAHLLLWYTCCGYMHWVVSPNTTL